MPGKLAKQIQQSKPFQSAEEEAFLNLLRTADALLQRESELLEGFGVTQAQYNVLRILRGAGESGLPCGEIAGRMITRDPDITRLADRLEKRGLTVRTREAADRRVVTVRITREGLQLLAALDKPVRDFHRNNLSHLGAANLKTLIDLLERAREKE
ncbi:MAG: MarR family transcriptional regulator [Bryobacterales bacterium]|nr:MarR family transcriptional regulator [Bryobacterales bacterium]